jgi:predicted house-cleaning NTP pyrophosphatase (Maf/HAM1 superfamily)
MARSDKGHLAIEDRGAVLIVRVDGGPHGLFGLEIANQLMRPASDRRDARRVADRVP